MDGSRTPHRGDPPAGPFGPGPRPVPGTDYQFELAGGWSAPTAPSRSPRRPPPHRR